MHPWPCKTISHLFQLFPKNLLINWIRGSIAGKQIPLLKAPIIPHLVMYNSIYIPNTFQIHFLILHNCYSSHYANWFHYKKSLKPQSAFIQHLPHFVSIKNMQLGFSAFTMLRRKITESELPILLQFQEKILRFAGEHILSRHPSLLKIQMLSRRRSPLILPKFLRPLCPFSCFFFPGPGFAKGFIIYWLIPSQSS